MAENYYGISKEDAIKGLKADSMEEKCGALDGIMSYGENGAVTLGYAPEVAAMLDDASLDVQISAVQALGCLGVKGAECGSALIKKLKSEEMDLRVGVLSAIEQWGKHGQPFEGDVAGMLDDQEAAVICQALKCLGAMKAKNSAGRISGKLSDKDPDVVCAAIAGLAKMDEMPDAAKWMGLAKHSSARVRRQAVSAFHELDHAHEAKEQMAKMLGDSDGFVRGAAIKYVEHHGDKLDKYADVVAGLLTNGDGGVRAAAALALGEMKVMKPDLERLLDDDHEDRSTAVLAISGVEPKSPATHRKPACAAAVALGHIAGKEGGEKAATLASKVAAGLRKPHFENRIACCHALGHMKHAGKAHEGEILEMLHDPNPMVAAEACKTIGNLAEHGSPSSEMAEAMVEKLSATHPAIKCAAAVALSKMGEEGTAHLEEIVKLLSAKVWVVRIAAIEAVSHMGEPGQMYANLVCRMLWDQHMKVRIAACKGLTKMGHRGEAFAEEVATLLEDPGQEIRIAALDTLGEFKHTGRPFKDLVEKLKSDPISAVKEKAEHVAKKME